MDKHIWMKYCELTGANDWAIAEGGDDMEEREITLEHAIKLGLVPTYYNDREW